MQEQTPAVQSAVEATTPAEVQPTETAEPIVPVVNAKEEAPKVESLSTLGNAVVMPEWLMPAEEPEPPKPVICTNCGKLGGDCSSIIAHCRELKKTNKELRKEQAEHIA